MDAAKRGQFLVLHNLFEARDAGEVGRSGTSRSESRTEHGGYGIDREDVPMNDAKTWLLDHGYSQWCDGVWQMGGYEIDIESVLQEYINEMHERLEEI